MQNFESTMAQVPIFIEAARRVTTIAQVCFEHMFAAVGLQMIVMVSLNLLYLRLKPASLL